MAGLSRDQGVPLHRGLHQLGASTNSNKLLYRLSRVHRPPASWFCFRTLAVAYSPLQLTKSLSIVTMYLIWTGYSQTWVKAAQARLYPGILWPEPIYTPVYIMAW